MWLPETEKVLNVLSEEERIKDYVFVGGSAMSYYLNHRLSEDIDLAYPAETLKMDDSIDRIISNLSKKGISIVEKPESASRHYERIYFANGVKLEFYAANENSLENRRIILKNNLYIADLDTLIAIKGMVIHNRAKLRDYYDLYAVNNIYGIDKIILETQRFYNTEKLSRFNKANFFQEIVNLSDIKEEKIDSYLNPKYDIAKSEMQSYFENEIKKYIEKEFIKSKNQIIENKAHSIIQESESPMPNDFTQNPQNKPETKPEIKRKFRR